MDVQPHFFDVGRVDVAVGITARNHGPGPDIGGHVVKTDLAGHGVSVFVPFEGTEAPEVTAQVEGEISAEFAHRTGGTLTLRRGDGSSDALHWTASLAQPLFICDDGGTSASTDGCVLHIRRDAQGGILTSQALDDTYCELSG